MTSLMLNSLHMIPLSRGAGLAANKEDPHSDEEENSLAFRVPVKAHLSRFMALIFFICLPSRPPSR